MVTYFNKIMSLVDNFYLAFSPHYLSSFSCFYNIFKYLPTKQKNLILIFFFLILEVMHVTFKNFFLTWIIPFIKKYALIFVV